MKNLQIVSAKYENSIGSITVILHNSETGEEFPFGYTANSNDESPITLWLNELWKSGKITPDPFVEPVQSEEDLARCIRNKRNTILSNTDYLVNSDYPISKADKTRVKEYRQLLRDITKQQDFPNNVEWPITPECIEK